MAEHNEDDYIDVFLSLFKTKNKSRIAKQRQIYKAGKQLTVVAQENNEETKNNE